MKKFLFDLFPLILFFIAYRFGDIYTATAVAIVASIAQIAWLKLRNKSIEAMHWLNLSVIVLFGGATLWLHSNVFIKWKPTVLYWLFGGVLASSRLFWGRNLVRRLLAAQIELPEPVWNRVNTSWMVFFIGAGALNLYVAFSGRFTEQQWVNFKVFGLMGLLLAFVIAQSVWLGRQLRPPKDPSEQGQDVSK
jgi:intracellular septation protein